MALSKTGEVLERYPLKGFADVEGMAYMGNGQVVLLEEISQRLNFIKLPDTPGELDSKNAQYISLGTRMNGKNKGLEGVSYDAEHDRLFVVKERDPRQLFEISGVRKSLEQGLHVEIRDLTQWIENGVFAKDLSDIYYDPGSGHIALLSHESTLLIELSEKGEVVSFRTFLGRLSDLKESAPQAEGVTMDNAGNLYMVSEPNLFYVFSKEKHLPALPLTAK
ncbi:MAG: SdiA-regulated domain-containing protein [Pseudomonas sp.]